MIEQLTHLPKIQDLEIPVRVGERDRPKKIRFYPETDISEDVKARMFGDLAAVTYKGYAYANLLFGLHHLYPDDRVVELVDEVGVVELQNEFERLAASSKGYSRKPQIRELIRLKTIDSDLFDAIHPKKIDLGKEARKHSLDTSNPFEYKLAVPNAAFSKSLIALWVDRFAQGNLNNGSNTHLNYPAQAKALFPKEFSERIYINEYDWKWINYWVFKFQNNSSMFAEMALEYAMLTCERVEFPEPFKMRLVWPAQDTPKPTASSSPLPTERSITANV